MSDKKDSTNPIFSLCEAEVLLAGRDSAERVKLAIDSVARLVTAARAGRRNRSGNIVFHKGDEADRFAAALAEFQGF